MPAICHHRFVAISDSMILFAQQTDYWFAGILTIIAAALVTVVILASSRSDNDKSA
jgi:hypothetical protein